MQIPRPIKSDKKEICYQLDACDRVSMPMLGWSLFSNPFRKLPAQRLSLLLYYTSPQSSSYRHLVAACQETKNLMLEDVKEIYSYPESFKTENLGKLRKVMFQSGGSYEGEWHLGQRHGFGKQVFSDKSVYEGDWSFNCAHGEGRFIVYSKEAREEDSAAVILTEYIGQWKYNCPEGLGVLSTLNDMWNYAGHWVRDKQDGYGVEYDSQKQFYAGEFRNGCRNGPGVFSSKNKVKFSASWNHDMICGEGRIIYNDNLSYLGQIDNGVRNGLGRTSIASAMYQGEYWDDMRHGLGEYRWDDGRAYLGYWIKDVMHGDGKLYLDARSNGVPCVIKNGQVVALGKREDIAYFENPMKTDSLECHMSEESIVSDDQEQRNLDTVSLSASEVSSI